MKISKKRGLWKNFGPKLGFSTKKGFKIRDSPNFVIPFGTKNHEMRGPPVCVKKVHNIGYFILGGIHDRDLWELKLYCKYCRQKGFIIEWTINKVNSSKYEWPLDVLTETLRAEALLQILQTKRFYSWMNIQMFLSKSTKQNLWAVPAELGGRPHPMAFRKIQGWRNWGACPPSNFDRSIGQVIMPTTFLLAPSDF